MFEHIWNIMEGCLKTENNGENLLLVRKTQQDMLTGDCLTAEHGPGTRINGWITRQRVNFFRYTVISIHRKNTSLWRVVCSSSVRRGGYVRCFLSFRCVLFQPICGLLVINCYQMQSNTLSSSSKMSNMR